MQFRRKVDKRLLAGVSMAVVMSTTMVVGHAQVNYANTFYKTGGYTYCDAKLLAGLWKESVWEAKVIAGDKLAHGLADAVREQLQDARNQAGRNNVSCSFEDADNPQYTYDDAVKLANYWGEPTPYDAKLKIGRLLQDGYNDAIRSALRSAS